MLENLIRNNVTNAVQRKDNVERDVLRLALSEIERESLKGDITEQQKENIIRKLIKSNISTLELMDESNKERKILNKEIDCLQTLLPKEMTKKDILNFIKDNNIQLINESVGKSTGMVMKVIRENKTIKESKIFVDGKLVKQAITEIINNKA